MLAGVGPVVDDPVDLANLISTLSTLVAARSAFRMPTEELSSNLVRVLKV